jgi:hypothetical protein
MYNLSQTQGPKGDYTEHENCTRGGESGRRRAEKPRLLREDRRREDNGREEEEEREETYKTSLGRGGSLTQVA